MKIIETKIPDVKLIEPNVFDDQRGFFYESFNQKNFNEAIGYPISFVQDNHSRSVKDTIRGIHYQLPPHPQGKLVRVTAGKVFDVAVDLRKSSPTFGKWVGELLSDENRRQLWIPPGFAHGFLVLSDSAEFQYKCTDFYAPECEQTIYWQDEELGIAWPIRKGKNPIVSGKDNAGISFKDAPYFQ
jgi:dTDP-4-dehydrorhamnose 3,5-epimerase